jgi:hypothetical protein
MTHSRLVYLLQDVQSVVELLFASGDLHGGLLSVACGEYLTHSGVIPPCFSEINLREKLAPTRLRGNSRGHGFQAPCDSGLVLEWTRLPNPTGYPAQAPGADVVFEARHILVQNTP